MRHSVEERGFHLRQTWCNLVQGVLLSGTRKYAWFNAADTLELGFTRSGPCRNADLAAGSLSRKKHRCDSRHAH